MSFNDIFRGKKILLTGHTGFKGSWLATWLVHLGAEVHGFALPPQSDKDNFLATQLASKIHSAFGDINDWDTLSAYFKKVAPDVIFHLAAQPLVLESYRNPRQTFQTNLMGVVNVLEAARDIPNLKAFVHVTSDKCYHNNEWVWGYRETDPMGGNDPYSASKGCAELITHAYVHSFFNEKNQVLVATARAGNVIGGGDWAENRIVPDFFRAYTSQQSLFLRHPKATRPWEFVLEPLSGYLALAEKLLMGDKAFTGAWNFGPKDPKNFSVEELVAAFCAKLPEMEYAVDTQPALHEAALLKLDVSKAISKLKWSPALSFAETVDFTFKGYMDQLNGQNDLYTSRIEQIQLYTQKAHELQIAWTQ